MTSLYWTTLRICQHFGRMTLIQVTPFTKAALQGDLGTVRDYVARQTFDPASKKAQHALLVACRTGNVEMTRVLLDAGVDVHCKDAKSGWQPIHIATYRDHVAVVEALAMHGEWRRGVALVRFRGITCNLLHLAANFGCLAVLRYLLSHTVRLGLHLEVRDAAHWTALHHAAFEGRAQAVTLLLQAGADINTADPHGVTPLHAAAYNDHTSIVRFLLSRGANPKMIVKTPTSDLCRTERGLERVEPILKFHVGSTLLHWAASKGYDDLVVDLLVRGLSVDACDRLGRTPLGLATFAGHTSIVNTLLQENASLSAEDKDWRIISREEVGLCIVRVIEETAVCSLDAARSDGFTLLHLAAQQGYPNMMHRLLSLKVSPDVRNNQGETPLFVAIRNNQLACVQQLINAGTRLNLVDNRGGSALHMAAKNGNVTEAEGFLANLTDNPDKINFLLTVFFILLPITLLSTWNLYIHVTQQDILPIFKLLPSFLRVSLYTLIFLTPLAPVMAYLENTYAQMKHMNVTARQMQEVGVDSKSYNSFPPHGPTKTYRHHMRDMEIRKYYDLKHVAQMRVAITNVMEATLESAFQLILQLYIVGTHYTELDQVKDVTLGSILSLSPLGHNTQLSKQVFSVLISLVSLTWSFTSYHRFSKLGGLTILNALPLLFAIFFQVVSRAIACTVFTLAHTWKVFVVLGVHFVVVLVFKLKLEESSVLPVRTPFYCCQCFFMYLRPYFYVFLGTIASTLVYFRLERPSAVKKQRARRHSTVVIQVLFLVLAFIENLVLLALGICWLDDKYDNTFIIISAVLCAISYLTGVILHAVYYSCFGHPWVDINGPSVHRDADEGTLVLSYYQQGKLQIPRGNFWVKWLH